MYILIEKEFDWDSASHTYVNRTSGGFPVFAAKSASAVMRQWVKSSIEKLLEFAGSDEILNQYSGLNGVPSWDPDLIEELTGNPSDWHLPPEPMMSKKDALRLALSEPGFFFTLFKMEKAGMAIEIPFSPDLLNEKDRKWFDEHLTTLR